jgi:hypothetical protein
MLICLTSLMLLRKECFHRSLIEIYFKLTFAAHVYAIFLWINKHLAPAWDFFFLLLGRYLNEPWQY